MYLGTTGAQKGAEVQVCYMHIFYIFKIIVQLRLLLLSIFVYNGYSSTVGCCNIFKPKRNIGPTDMMKCFIFGDSKVSP